MQYNHEVTAMSKMNFFKGIFIYFCFLASAFAQDNATQSLTELLKNIHSMQANFTQSLLDNHGKVIHQSKGKMFLQRPGKFRWETLTPNPQLIVANGKRLWIYDKDLEQVVIRPLAKQTGETPSLLLSDENLALDKDFSITQKSNAFVLIPKDKSSMMESIQMKFNGEQISEMRLQDHLGHFTVIQFLNVKMNGPVSASLFQFSIPKHIDVIDETKH
jgi:outer membrane lipoprotein carrier protein